MPDVPRPLPPCRRRSRPRAALAVPLLSLALALLVSGCAADDPTATPATTGSPSATAAASGTPAGTPTGTPAGTPTDTASTTGPTPGGTGRSTQVPPSSDPLGRRALTPARPAVQAHLLSAGRLPRLGDGTVWSEIGTGTGDDSAVGVCQKTDLTAIGATEAVRRTFTATLEDSAPGSSPEEAVGRATQVVAAFPDGRSTWRARRVLLSWHQDCAERLAEAARPRIGPLTEVAVARGVGGHYRSAYDAGGQDERTVAGLGILRKGRRLVLVEVAAPASAYPAGISPARVALRRVSRTFG